MRISTAALLLWAGCVIFSGRVRAQENPAGPAVLDLADALPSPQIRFTQDRQSALVGRLTKLQLTVDPPQPVKLSLAMQSSDPRILYVVGLDDVFPDQSVVIKHVWALQASYLPVTVTATLLLDSMGGPSATTIVDTSNPQPIIRGIDPLSTPAGSPGMTLLVIGSLTPNSTFVSDSVAYWNGSPRPTRPVPVSICPDVCIELLDVSLSDADLASPGTATLVLVNPPPGGGVSNEVAFQIGPAGNGKKRPKKPLTQTVIFHDLLVRRPIGPRH